MLLRSAHSLSHLKTTLVRLASLCFRLQWNDDLSLENNKQIPRGRATQRELGNPYSKRLGTWLDTSFCSKTCGRPSLCLSVKERNP